MSDSCIQSQSYPSYRIFLHGRRSVLQSGLGSRVVQHRVIQINFAPPTQDLPIFAGRGKTCFFAGQGGVGRGAHPYLIFVMSAVIAVHMGQENDS